MVKSTCFDNLPPIKAPANNGQDLQILIAGLYCTYIKTMRPFGAAAKKVSILLFSDASLPLYKMVCSSKMCLFKSRNERVNHQAIHPLVRLLVCSHRSFTLLLLTARFVRSLIHSMSSLCLHPKHVHPKHDSC